MKGIKSLFLFGVSLLFASSCFDPPEFSNTPEIEFTDIYFKEVEGTSVPDSLVLTISFKDGDGDLGLTANEIDSPYHEQDYFVDDDGKLITVRTRKKTGNENIPPFEDPYKCKNYVFDTLFVSESDKSAFDKTYNVIDSFFNNGTKVYSILDTFYVVKNPNHYNITIQFFTRNNGDFVEFDWGSVYPFPQCGETFNGRFPLLITQDENNPLEGNIKYTLRSNGFVPFFTVKPLKLRIQIKDRALNQSNIIETPEFTLESIKRR